MQRELADLRLELVEQATRLPGLSSLSSTSPILPLPRTPQNTTTRLQTVGRNRTLPALTKPSSPFSCYTPPNMDGSIRALGNVEGFSGILDGLRSQFPSSTLVLSSRDDFIPGPRYFAASDGANDPVLGVSGEGRGAFKFLWPNSILSLGLTLDR